MGLADKKEYKQLKEQGENMGKTKKETTPEKKQGKTKEEKAKELIELVKKEGAVYVDARMKYILATGEHLQCGGLIETLPEHFIKIREGIDFQAAPFWFLLEPTDKHRSIEYFCSKNEEETIAFMYTLGGE